MQTVNWEVGKRGGCRDKSGTARKGRINRELEETLRTNREVRRDQAVNCKLWIRHFHSCKSSVSIHNVHFMVDAPLMNTSWGGIIMLLDVHSYSLRHYYWRQERQYLFGRDVLSATTTQFVEIGATQIVNINFFVFGFPCAETWQFKNCCCSTFVVSPRFWGAWRREHFLCNHHKSATFEISLLDAATVRNLDVSVRAIWIKTR